MAFRSRWKTHGSCGSDDPSNGRKDGAEGGIDRIGLPENLPAEEQLCDLPHC
jgi:hypothetical protein